MMTVPAINARAALIAAVLLAVACGASDQGLPGPARPAPLDASPPPGGAPDDEGRDLVDVADLGPYFADVFGGEAAAALDDDRLEDAMRGFDDIAAGLEDPVLTPRAQFLAAYLAARLGDHARALSELPGLGRQLPLVADTALETAARSAMALGKFDSAARLADSISDAGVLAPVGDMIGADARRRAGDYPAAAAAYRSYLADWPDSDGALQARARLVECVARGAKEGAAPDPALIEEALAMVDVLRAQSPLGKWTQEAAAHEPALLVALGREAPTGAAALPAALEAYDEAVDLMNRKQNKAAERALNKAIRLARDDGELECRARLDKGTVLVRQRVHGKAALILEAVAEDCEDPNVRVRALFTGGKAFVAADRCADAIRLFDRIEAEFADHTYADDARLHAARCNLALGDRDAVGRLEGAMERHHSAASDPIGLAERNGPTSVESVVQGTISVVLEDQVMFASESRVEGDTEEIFISSLIRGKLYFAKEFFPRVDFETCSNHVLSRILNFLNSV